MTEQVVRPTDTAAVQHAPQYGQRRSPVVGIIAVTGLLLGAAVLAMVDWTKDSLATDAAGQPVQPLMVYAGAGLRQTLESVARDFTAETQVPVEFNFGSSGQMEANIRLEADANTARADVFIPADKSFIKRTGQDGLTAEAISFARMRLVLAWAPTTEQRVTGVQDLIAQQIPLVVCDPSAAAGKKTKKILGSAYDQLNPVIRVVKPTVTEAANAIKTSDTVQAGIIWSITAEQFGLPYQDLPELGRSESLVSGAVVASSTAPTQGLAFLRYLAAPNKGQQAWQEFGFIPEPGDTWAKQPRLVLYSGSVNRKAVEKTVAEFEQREGCRIDVTYAGCGTLVGQINSGQKSDIYFTCDASFLAMVADDYGEQYDVSATDIVMVVRAGNPLGVTDLSSALDPKIRVGTSDPHKSALGTLTWNMFRAAGIADTLRANDQIIATMPTAHELLVAVENSERIDVAFVYRANANYIDQEKLEIISIDRDDALAVQNIAVGKASPYQQMGQRLMAAILANDSRQRFLENGFWWRGNKQSVGTATANTQ